MVQLVNVDEAEQGVLLRLEVADHRRVYLLFLDARLRLKLVKRVHQAFELLIRRDLRHVLEKHHAVEAVLSVEVINCFRNQRLLSDAFCAPDIH